MKNSFLGSVIVSVLSSITLSHVALAKDTKKPVVEKFSSQMSTIEGGQSVSFNFIASDDTGLKSAELWRKKDNGAWVRVGDPQALTKKKETGTFNDNPSAGRYIYGIHVSDMAGNMGQEGTAINLIVNAKVSPVVESFVASATTIQVGQSVQLNYRVSDNTWLKLVELYRKADGGSWATIGTTLLDSQSSTGKFTDTPAPGNYAYGMHVTDVAGNWSAERNSVQVSVQSVPVIKKFSVAEPFLQSGKNAVFSVSAADPVGLSTMELWRKENGKDGSDSEGWSKINEVDLKGKTNVENTTISDNAPPNGGYIYGIHVKNKLGLVKNEAEKEKIKVSVYSPTLGRNTLPWPMAGVGLKDTSIHFGKDDSAGTDRMCAKHPPMHLGLDIAAKEGTAVRAISPGLVVRNGTVGAAVWGFHVAVASPGNTWTTSYLHLRGDKRPAEQTYIHIGDVVGYLTDLTGTDDVSHLHLGIRLSPYSDQDRSGPVRGYDDSCKGNKYNFSDPLNFLIRPEFEISEGSDESSFDGTFYFGKGYQLKTVPQLEMNVSITNNGKYIVYGKWPYLSNGGKVIYEMVDPKNNSLGLITVDYSKPENKGLWKEVLLTSTLQAGQYKLRVKQQDPKKLIPISLDAVMVVRQ